MILTVITLVIQLLPGILQSAGIITPAIESLITQLGAAIPTLIKNLAAGKSAGSDVMTLLSALQAELITLQKTAGLQGQGLADSITLVHALNNAITAYQAAGVVDDPSTLTMLPTNLEDTAPLGQTAAGAAEAANVLQQAPLTPETIVAETIGLGEAARLGASPAGVTTQSPVAIPEPGAAAAAPATTAPVDTAPATGEGQTVNSGEGQAIPATTAPVDTALPTGDGQPPAEPSTK